MKPTRKLLALELHLAGAEFEDDLLVLGAVDLRRRGALDEFEGLEHALLQAGDGRLRRAEVGLRQSGQLGDAARGMGADLADLDVQRKHVGIEPGAQQHGLVELLGFREGRRLVEHAAERGQIAHENRHRYLIHRNGHWRFLFVF